MKFRVSLKHPLPDMWPHTKIGDGVVVDYETAAMAIHEVADEHGIAHHTLKATPVSAGVMRRWAWRLLPVFEDRFALLVVHRLAKRGDDDRNQTARMLRKRRKVVA